jgi:hypothetical protein
MVELKSKDLRLRNDKQDKGAFRRNRMGWRHCKVNQDDSKRAIKSHIVFEFVRIVLIENHKTLSNT